MPKTTVAEWILKRAEGAERGTAIYGDLTELATTRGRTWFWLAYARTMVALTWRTVAAFAIMYSYLRSPWVLGAIRSFMHWLFRWVPYASHEYRPPAWYFHLTPLSMLLTGLYFLTPFLLVRFGLRDRLTQLASVLFLVSLSTYSNRLLVAVPVMAITAATVFVALCLRQWCRPMLVLALCLTPRYALLWTFIHTFQPGHRTPLAIRLFSGDTTILMAALLCLWLHHWSLESRAIRTAHA